jgi:hypothetical protein
VFNKFFHVFCPVFFVIFGLVGCDKHTTPGGGGTATALWYEFCGGEVDADCDGYLEPADCDDADSAVSPYAVEVCDEIDNDCNGEVDEDLPMLEWYPDDDGDSYGEDGSEPILDCREPRGRYTWRDGDCDDSNISVNPAVPEHCNSIDDNCDGIVDIDAWDTHEWYPDVDGDGYGDELAEPVSACYQPPGYSDWPADCDDTNAEIYPRVAEVCNNVDDDCDGWVDDGLTCE